MPLEKPHRRLALTQPTAVPTYSTQEEKFVSDTQEVEHRLRTELAAIQERLDAWDSRLLRLTEAVERATAAQRVVATRTFQSASPDPATVFPRCTASLSNQERSGNPPSTSQPSPIGHERRVRIATRAVQLENAAPEENGSQTKIEAQPATDPPLDRVRIPVRETGRRVISYPSQ